MKDIELALRTAYYNLLNGISVEGKTVHFFDKRAPIGHSTPYIIWSGMTDMAWNTKSSFGDEVKVHLLIYDPTFENAGNSRMVEKVASKVKELLTPSPGVNGLTSSEIGIINTIIRSTDSEFYRPDTQDTYRKRITVEHLISQ